MEIHFGQQKSSVTNKLTFKDVPENSFFIDGAGDLAIKYADKNICKLSGENSVVIKLHTKDSIEPFGYEYSNDSGVKCYFASGSIVLKEPRINSES